MPALGDHATHIATFVAARPYIAVTSSTEPKLIKAKVPGLDAVRFLTAVVVMLYHLCYWRDGSIAASDSVYSFWSFGWVGVEIFFAISGFVIAYSAATATPNQFALSRWVRLLPMIWICATLTLVGTAWLAPGADPDLIAHYWHTIFFRLTGTHIDIVYWTLTVEIAFYIACYLLLRAQGFALLLKVLIGIGVVSAIFDIALAATQLPGGSHGAIGNAVLQFSQKTIARLLLVRYGCFFALGAVIWARRTAYRPRALVLIACVLVIGATAEVLCSAFEQSATYPLEHLSLLVAPIAWLIGLGLIFLSGVPRATAGLQRPQVVRALRTLGLLTFPLYLLHNSPAFQSGRHCRGNLLLPCAVLPGIGRSWPRARRGGVVLLVVEGWEVRKRDARAVRIWQRLFPIATPGP